MSHSFLFRLLRHPGVGLALLALIAGVLAAVSMNAYLHKQEQALRQASERPQLQRVVAAAMLAPGTVLQTEHLAARAYPAELVPSDSLDASHFRELAGMTLIQGLKAGDLITHAHVRGQTGPFSEQLISGRRAVTVPVDALSSVSGLIRPGDLIDLYVSFDDQQRRVTAPLLQAVPVLATGQRSQEQDAALLAQDQDYSTLTLDVGPDEALKLLAARQHGRITALLRHPDDQSPYQAAVRGELADILGLGASGRAGRRIEVLYGNRSGGEAGLPELEKLGWLNLPGSGATVKEQP
ncbi:Flp pilus assembly protein CpaB [Alcaligenes sp. SDU_A2]|uniref:Flp pilus assembly protein CpaB n=1 Tax=Alcaligenes sp. SDU_A2 TaxID=3136634 RepID=UPI00311F0B9E